jgi:glycosyltransferase involved in cell wall biosynthesis
MALPLQRRLKVAIMGIRGIPAAHGGFESFTERLAPFLAELGWHVTVYCQEDGPGDLSTSQLGEVHRVHIPSGQDTPVASMRFDWACIRHVCSQDHRPDVVLILGYNTAAFAARLRLAGLPTVINMDGIEWSRAKWGRAAKAWLYFNERMGCWLGNHLLADHPAIARHLATRVRADKITTIPYGGDVSAGGEGTETSSAPLQTLRLQPRAFVTVIARAEPENSILEIVQAFSSKPRGIKLVVLGNYEPEHSAFHAQVLAAASAEVVFPGAIYDAQMVQALRVHSLLYVHGHQVGGTNPSLLEAMGAGNAVLAHDNPFNRWVVGEGARYFSDSATCADMLDTLLTASVDLDRMGALNRERVSKVFDWQAVLFAYASLLQDVARQASHIELAAKANSFWSQHTI